jgi:hypothetical protein
LPEGRAEELNEAGAGELVAVGAFELAVVEEEIAGDAHAEGYFGSWGSGYLDSFVRCLFFRTPGYLDRGALGAWVRVGLIGSGAVVPFIAIDASGYLDSGGFVVGFGRKLSRDAS